VAIGALMVLILLFSALRFERAPVATPTNVETSEPSVEPPSSLDDALDRLEEAVQP
jgi:hypothetical protein